MCHWSPGRRGGHTRFTWCTTVFKASGPLYGPLGAMSAELDPLAVVNQLRDLAADPMNCRAIVQDRGCLPGLILFLDNPNPQVVYSALLAIRYLAEYRANQQQLKEELGMLPSLHNVTHKSTTPGETRLLASEIYELLQSSSCSSSGRAQEAVGSSSRRKAQFFMGSSNKRAKTVVLHIDGLDDYGSMRGGPAEGQRRHQLHLSDDHKEVRGPDPIGPEGRGSRLCDRLHSGDDGSAGDESGERRRGLCPAGGRRLCPGSAGSGPARLPAGGGESVSGARQGGEPGCFWPGWEQLARGRHQLHVPLLLLVTSSIH
ncbi:uncharacterized protein AB9W97_021014 isoform 1-T1 [Spinachia spinachia]